MDHLRMRIWPLGVVMLLMTLSLPSVTAHAFTPQTIVIDGVNDFDPSNLLDDDTGDTEIKDWCTNDPEVDAPMDLGKIYVTNDANNLYIGFEYYRDCFASPQVNLGVAFSYGTPGDGGTTDPFARKIAWNTIANKPDNVLYDVIDGFNYEVLYHWNGATWDNISTTVNPGWGSGSNGLGIADDTGFEEISLPLSVFGVAPGGTINLEIWMTQDGTSKPPLDAMASDDVQTSTPSGTVFDVTTAVEMTATLPYVVQAAVDNPPVLTQAVRTAAATLQLNFNEPVDATTGGNIANYSLSGGATAATVTAATVDAGVPSIVHLTLSGDLEGASTAYTVTVNDVQDLTGNPIVSDGISNVACFGLKGVTFEGKFASYLQSNSSPPDGFTVEGSKAPLTFTVCDGGDMVQVDAINEIWQYSTLFSFPVQCSDSSGSLTVEWKFNHNCTDWETVGNRSFTLNMASPATQTLSHFWDDLDPTSFTDKDIDVIFKVDMSQFSPIPMVDEVGLAGSEAPLSFTAPFMTMVDDGSGQDEVAGDQIYTGVATFPAGTLKHVGYKYTLNGSFECPETGNRDVYLNDTMYDTIGGTNGPLALPLAYYNRCYVIGHDVQVVFRVDVGNSSVAGSGGTLDMRVAGSQPPLDWDPNFAPSMHDDGIAPDAAAGDDVYTLAVTFSDSTNYYLEYKYTVGGIFEGQDQPNRSVFLDDAYDASGNPQILPIDQLHHTVPTAAPNVPSGAHTRLVAAWPNPFNPRTTLVFEVATRSKVSLAIYDARGRLVNQLVDSVQAPGRHELQWDGTSDAGNPVSSGVYYARLLADGSAGGLKLVLLK